jgi:hypothetical protein
VDVLIGWPGGDWQATARLSGTLVVGYVALLWLASLMWIYRDITSRTRDPVTQIVCMGIGVVLPIVGLPIYMALRPAETLQQAYDREVEQEAILAEIQTSSSCPNCNRPAEPAFRVCAYCGTPLKEPCLRCREPMLLAWRYCPHCATPRAVAAPAQRLDFSTGDDAYDEPVRPVTPSIAGRTAVRRRPPTRTSAEGDREPPRTPRSTED